MNEEPMLTFRYRDSAAEGDDIATEAPGGRRALHALWVASRYAVDGIRETIGLIEASGDLSHLKHVRKKLAIAEAAEAHAAKQYSEAGP